MNKNLHLWIRKWIAHCNLLNISPPESTLTLWTWRLSSCGWCLMGFGKNMLRRRQWDVHVATCLMIPSWLTLVGLSMYYLELSNSGTTWLGSFERRDLESDSDGGEQLEAKKRVRASLDTLSRCQPVCIIFWACECHEPKLPWSEFNLGFLVIFYPLVDRRILLINWTIQLPDLHYMHGWTWRQLGLPHDTAKGFANCNVSTII